MGVVRSGNNQNQHPQRRQGVPTLRVPVLPKTPRCVGVILVVHASASLAQSTATWSQACLRFLSLWLGISAQSPLVLSP